MHLPTLALLALPTLSLASVLPRSESGAWAVTLSKFASASGHESQTLSANFTSTAYPAGLVSTCSYVYNPRSEPKETSSCDNEAFEYEYDGQTIKLQQSVELPTVQTVFGSAPLALKADVVGRTFSGEATVEVTAASA